MGRISAPFKLSQPAPEHVFWGLFMPEMYPIGDYFRYYLRFLAFKGKKT